jgi:predicted HTH transcriptional regulator
VRQTDLDILLHEGEGSMLEYKESFSSSLARELVAFANSAGGKILLGVRDDRSSGAWRRNGGSSPNCADAVCTIAKRKP